MIERTIELNAERSNAAVTLHAVVGEDGSRKAKATLTQMDGTPINLTGKSVQLYVGKADGKSCLLDGTIKDAENGVAEFTLSQQSTAVEGKASLEIWIADTQASVLKIIGLTLDVKASGETEIKSTNEFQSLIAATVEAKTAAAKADTAADGADVSAAKAAAATAKADTAAGNANSATADARTAITDCNTAAENANSKAALANTAAENANTAAENANSKAQTAQTAATRADEAAGKVDGALAGEIGPAIDAVITEQKGRANGLAGLDANGTVPVAQLPVVPVNKGGTGKTSLTAGGVLYASDANTVAQSSAPTETGQFIRSAANQGLEWINSTDVPATIGALPITGGNIWGTIYAIRDSYPGYWMEQSGSGRSGAIVMEGGTVSILNSAIGAENHQSQLAIGSDTGPLDTVLVVSRTTPTNPWKPYKVYGAHNVTTAASAPTEFIGEDNITFCTSNKSIYRGINGANVRFY